MQAYRVRSNALGGHRLLFFHLRKTLAILLAPPDYREPTESQTAERLYSVRVF